MAGGGASGTSRACSLEPIGLLETLEKNGVIKGTPLKRFKQIIRN